MEKIKKFYQDHKETIDPSLLIASGLCCAYAGILLLREMAKVDGMQVDGVDHFVRHDGDELIEVYLVNGMTKRFHKRNP